TNSYFIFREDTIIHEITTLGGIYYALIIGISDYTDPQITDLDGYPIQDAEKMAEILTNKYNFEKENIQLLKNPTRETIQRALDDLSKTVTDKDNLLIFYAGHGHYDEETELGYWLPSDAEKDYTTNWIYNDVLVANLRRIRAKHTLLISDACFSGSIFKTRSGIEDAPLAYQKKYELKSRKAITSGVLQTVPNKSVFFKYLTEDLESNQAHYFSASQLFQDIEIPVGNNSPNSPQFGVIRNVGDEGGDFIFMMK
ncbi:MAG: caspase family protein, partial [Bacteroidales bacterium]|nr:caspase family protein [Bacteroidales bacterium]